MLQQDGHLSIVKSQLSLSLLSVLVLTLASKTGRYFDFREQDWTLYFFLRLEVCCDIIEYS